MKFQSSFSTGECKERLQWGFRTHNRVEEDRYAGWVLGSVFSVSLMAGDETRKNFYPVSNKALGILKDKDGGTQGSIYYFKGLTDPVSLVFWIAVVFCVLLFVRSRYGLSLGQCLLGALIWTALVALVTYLYTNCSQEGKLATQHLREYITSTLGLEPEE